MCIHMCVVVFFFFFFINFISPPSIACNCVCVRVLEKEDGCVSETMCNIVHIPDSISAVNMSMCVDYVYRRMVA